MVSEAAPAKDTVLSEGSVSLLGLWSATLFAAAVGTGISAGAPTPSAAGSGGAVAVRIAMSCLAAWTQSSPSGEGIFSPAPD